MFISGCRDGVTGLTGTDAVLLKLGDGHKGVTRITATISIVIKCTYMIYQDGFFWN